MTERSQNTSKTKEASKGEKEPHNCQELYQKGGQEEIKMWDYNGDLFLQTTEPNSL